MQTLYCRLCHVGYGSVGEVPLRCPACDRETKWTTLNLGLPSEPVAVTPHDFRLLRSLRIAPD